MPGRQFVSSNTYRYGFNGKENDKETVGTGNGTQDYGMRIYNPALGKFLSIDPLARIYPGLTPYQFASNCPIWMIDLDGLEGNPYSGQVPELPADGGRYGKRGEDWGTVVNADKAVKKAENGFGPEGKYYWSPSTLYPGASEPGALIWQKAVKVTTYKDVEEVQWEKVVEVSPAIPPKDPTTKTEHKSYNSAVSSYAVPANSTASDAKRFTLPTINAEKGEITGIVLNVEINSPLNAQVQAALRKEFNVPVTLVVSKSPITPVPGQPNPDYSIITNYDVDKIIPGKPGKPGVKTETWIKKIVTKKVATEEVKQ